MSGQALGFRSGLTERIGELVRAHGLRRMPSRIAVLAVLEPVHGHRRLPIRPKAAQSLPAKDQPRFGAIYRTVTTLVDQGVLHALTLEGGVTTFGLAADPHHHAVCTRCGSIIEVPAGQLASALEQAMAQASPDPHQGLNLHGLCPQCQGDAGQAGSPRS